MAAEIGGVPVSVGEAAASWAVSRWHTVGRWRVRHRDAGLGPDIVLVHGLGVSADYWYRNGPPLAAAGYRVVAPDLPGFGRTQGPSDGLSVLEQASFLYDFAESMGIGPAIYVGHSLSCQVVLELAAAHPDRVAGLVLAAPTGDPRGHRLARQAWGLLLDAPREPARLIWEVTRAYLQAGPVRVWHTWRKGARESPLPLLPRVRAPALILLGTRDPVVPRDFADTLADGLPDGTIVCIDGAAHGLIFGDAEEFNHAVIDWANEAVPRVESTRRPLDGLDRR